MNWLLKLFAPTVPRKTRLVRAVLLFLLVLASGYRVWLVVAYNPMDWLYSDPARHWYTGTHPLDTAPMAAIDPVLYGTYIAALAKFTVGSPILVAYWTALLSLSCPWLWYRFLRELLPSRDTALAGWVIFSALPSWSVIYCYLMQETLMLPLLGAALWATWRCKRKRDLSSFLLATGAWMLAGLTRGICIPMAAVAMTYLWILQGDKLRKSVFAVALLMSVLGPLAGRSWYLARVISPHGMGNMASLYYRAGTVYMSFYFSRSGGTETWNYTFRSPAHYPFEPFSYWTGVRPGHVYFSIDLDHGMRDWNVERRNLPEWSVQRYQRMMSYNLIHLFIDHSWPELEHYDRAANQAARWMRWLWAPLSLYCLVATLLYWRRQRDHLLPALLLIWFLVQMHVALNEGRYRKPAEGLLIAQTLVLAAAASSRRRSRRAEADAAVAHARAEITPVP